ncbi:hypothetical protein COLO4_35685 [Corchorus olitorius]|uniref:non-specific serine/threonine protein kinase n=1 Tax=Corchorus olitorius TaxID=93759 RepID=A0A1R3GE21_9ROSI|nr:hypothetical protein COLO4_35685 [Corchorus olitorius]
MDFSTKKLRSSSKYLFSFFMIFFIGCCKSNAQSTQNATIDPSEVRTMKSIFQQWNMPVDWELCTSDSDSQSSDSDFIFDRDIAESAISCDCSFNNNTLCHITRLKVFTMNIQGVILKELLDLPYLTFLKLDRNFFSGPLPAFVGNMSRLRFLSIANNLFSGPIPKEVGNLKELYMLYIDSSGLGGEIPETFAKLENLQTVWASDIALTGKIPDFIGNNWRKLTELRFQGNHFEGPIPSSFANLTSLSTLRIGDIYNGSSSSLDFLRNLKKLNELVLRNVLLTGDLPSFITKFQSLQKLDLSFNNLTGQVPSALFNMSNLKYLFLGNNNLSGTFPSQKSDTLENIDLSYNFLSGDLPSWINSGIQLNLVANNFTSNSSNIRLLQGLECLQRSFPCNRDTPRYASFSIKCGGPQMIADGIMFEAEDRALGTATFNVSSGQKWGVSNVGWFADRQNQQFVKDSDVVVNNTSTPWLYQNSRLSPGSLRYYGLGLENGSYTVHLLFAETSFQDQSTHTWQSLVRRVFDVYIQGTRHLRDFDISKAAGGVEIAVTKSFTVNVTDNHLEIHLFWAGKGTCCVPEHGYYGPSISAINVVPNFKPTVGGMLRNKPKDKSHTTLVVGIAMPVAVMALVLIFAVVYVMRIKEDDDEEVLLGIGSRPNTFSYSELKAATQDFSPSNKLGEGGFGPVFKGTLSDGRVVAVKQLSIASHQGNDQFVTEIATISAVQHRNLVTLHGCCIEGNRRLLVYEYLENKSLDRALFGIHSGYLAPEYAMRGHLTEKADVFSFGVVALEVLSGIPNTDSNLGGDRIYVLEWAWTLHENNQILSVMDPKLVEFDENEALRVVGVALLCTQASPKMRPSMSRVVAMLAGDIEVSSVTSKPGYLTDWDFKDTIGTFMIADTLTPFAASTHNNINNSISKNDNTITVTGAEPMLSPINVTDFEQGR